MEPGEIPEGIAAWRDYFDDRMMEVDSTGFSMVQRSRFRTLWRLPLKLVG